MPQTHRFDGGLALAANKEQSTQTPVRRPAIPKRLILPLCQHLGAPADPIVVPGEKVMKGQCVATADGPISAALHASTSGTVAAIEGRPTNHPSGLAEPCIVIDSDGKDSWGVQPPSRSKRVPGALELSQIARDSGLVGLGGGAYPTALKLQSASSQSAELLLINGAECEPYVSCDDMLMRDRAKEIIGGALLICEALGIRESVVGIEDSKIESIDALQKAISDTPTCRVGIQAVPTIYPSGGEKQLIQAVTGREVPRDGMPADVGVLCHNVATLLALQNAVVDGQPLISRYVTVTGGGVSDPCNLEVLIGTPIRHLIEHCGGYRENAQRLIVGGPMMGSVAESDGAPVIKSTNCILVPGAGEFGPPKLPLPCIRCGDCVSVCPARLLPQQLYWHARAKNLDDLQEYGLFDCIECGCCAAVCPSHLPLVDYYRRAKTEIRAREKERETAENTGRRYRFRLERMDRNERERAEKMRKKRATLARNIPARDTEKSKVEAALARVRAKESAAPVGADAMNGDRIGPSDRLSDGSNK